VFVPLKFEVIMHRALADVRAAGGLPLPQFQIEIQPKDFTRLAHGHLLSGHLDLLSEAQVTRVGVQRRQARFHQRFRSISILIPAIADQ
jgi:hypothetical protein